MFSPLEREQVQAPAGRWSVGTISSACIFDGYYNGVDGVLQEHLAPTTLFSTSAFSQLQFRADCLPQEQVASAAQAQVPELRPQQVDGMVEVGADIVVMFVG